MRVQCTQIGVVTCTSCDRLNIYFLLFIITSRRRRSLIPILYIETHTCIKQHTYHNYACSSFNSPIQSDLKRVKEAVTSLKNLCIKQLVEVALKIHQSEKKWRERIQTTNERSCARGIGAWINFFVRVIAAGIQQMRQIENASG